MDVPLVNRNAVTAPKNYTLPQAQEILLKAVVADIDGTSASGTFLPALQLISDAGDVMWTAVNRSTPIAAGGSVSASWFPWGGVDTISPAASTAGVIVEQFFYLTTTTTPATSATTLQSGRPYVITVQGTYSEWDALLTEGTPNADAMSPTPGMRTTTEVGIDPECVFAKPPGPSAFPIGHTAFFTMDLGSGMTHIEPVGGPFATPQPNYFYTYNVVGQGHPVSVVNAQVPATDNYGKLLVTIQTVGGNSGGGGGGSLLPDPSQQADGSWLRTTSGTAVWKATPQVAETDLNFTDITTGNVSTTKHGLTPKLPNNAAQFLDGTGAYSTPAGTSPLTTKGDVYGFSTVNARIPIGTDTQVLTADSTQTLGLKWASPSPLTTKGDVYTFSTVNARLGVGSNNQVLLADSTQATGLRWGAVPAGAGGAVTLIGSQVLGGTQASFDTNTILGGAISGGYTHLLVVLYGRLDEAVTNDTIKMNFNNDTGANYDFCIGTMNANATYGGNGGVAQTSMQVANFPANTATANRFGHTSIMIPSYANTTGDKTFRSEGTLIRATAVTDMFDIRASGNWRSTAAITRIQLAPSTASNFVAGSSFSLYGLS